MPVSQASSTEDERDVDELQQQLGAHTVIDVADADAGTDTDTETDADANTDTDVDANANPDANAVVNDDDAADTASTNDDGARTFGAYMTQEDVLADRAAAAKPVDVQRIRDMMERDPARDPEAFSMLEASDMQAMLTGKMFYKRTRVLGHVYANKACKLMVTDDKEKRTCLPAFSLFTNDLKIFGDGMLFKVKVEGMPTSVVMDLFSYCFVYGGWVPTPYIENIPLATKDDDVQVAKEDLKEGELLMEKTIPTLIGFAYPVYPGDVRDGVLDEKGTVDAHDVVIDKTTFHEVLYQKLYFRECLGLLISMMDLINPDMWKNYKVNVIEELLCAVEFKLLMKATERLKTTMKEITWGNVEDIGPIPQEKFNDFIKNAGPYGYVLNDLNKTLKERAGKESKPLYCKCPDEMKGACKTYAREMEHNAKEYTAKASTEKDASAASATAATTDDDAVDPGLNTKERDGESVTFAIESRDTDAGDAKVEA
jgi:hypothetical protein